MHVNLLVTDSEEYFAQTDREIDWDGNDNTKVQFEKHEALQKILTTEVGIYLLRRATGICAGVVENMVEIRRLFIDRYEANYEPYVEHNDFY